MRRIALPSTPNSIRAFRTNQSLRVNLENSRFHASHDQLNIVSTSLRHIAYPDDLSADSRPRMLSGSHPHGLELLHAILATITPAFVGSIGFAVRAGFRPRWMGQFSANMERPLCISTPSRCGVPSPPTGRSCELINPLATARACLRGAMPQHLLQFAGYVRQSYTEADQWRGAT